MFEVFLKEIKELLRDRKTLMFIVALPLLIFPVIFAVVGYMMAMANLEAEQEVHKVYIIGAEAAPEFTEAVKYHKNFELVSADYANKNDIIQAIQNEELDVGIVIQAKAQPESREQTTWQVIYNDSARINYLFRYIEELKEQYQSKVQTLSFNALGVTKESEMEFLISPIKLEKVDTADARESWGEKIGVLLPYLLIPIVLTGAVYPAIDLGAGEKERGTLETLLLTPISRTNIVLGKFLTVLSASLATASLSILSMGLWLFVARTFVNVSEFTVALSHITFVELLAMLSLLIPLAAMFSSIVLSISIYARTFKEAQNYMGPLSMLVFIPVMISVMPNMELTYKTAFIPVTNVALAIKELLKGTSEIGILAVIVGSSILLAVGLLAFCVRWFNQEKVLFR
ncbi:ABC transporter permease [Pseudoalteromonas sp. BDTF-M6]|uniref:ABC transporter permease n=1 Tax=Pseudoalteromonas sp. BDTF-M6 TaxID=2796132 RepID=UPI001BAF4653|nr:ABC transporter permease [Pseudoalteromonas sp. BDTF-M6]MBS3796836.1 ABC transporter permease [Pseudoalteromonas sp. BDTF-M6]